MQKLVTCCGIIVVELMIEMLEKFRSESIVEYSCLIRKNSNILGKTNTWIDDFT